MEKDSNTEKTWERTCKRTWERTQTQRKHGKEWVKRHVILVIFDDLISSSYLKSIANLFTVDARHMNMSMVFLTQKMFVNCEQLRQISQNCDYFAIFKNPRNSSEIRTLAQQMTPGKIILVQNYICLLYTSPSPRDAHESRMPSSA